MTVSSNLNLKFSKRGEPASHMRPNYTACIAAAAAARATDYGPGCAGSLIRLTLRLRRRQPSDMSEDRGGAIRRRGDGDR